ncbi:glycosyltransferase family 4 protein [Lysobacter sp. HA35]
MRSLLVTRNFPPLVGGMERLNEHVLLALSKLGSASLAGPRGCRRFAGEAVVAEFPVGHPAATVVAAALKGAWYARHARPELIVGGSGLMAPAVLMAGRISGAATAVYLHGLDIVAPSAIYRAIWLPAIRRCDRVIVNSGHTRALAITAGVLVQRITVIHPGTELPPPRPERALAFRARLDIAADAPLLVSVGRLTARKGLESWVRHALPRLVRRWPSLRLLVIGDEPSSALLQRGGQGFAPIAMAAKAAGMQDAITWLGARPDEDVADALEAADLHVFPVLDMPGDVEGFGMVAVEAAARGTPTVAFAVGGVPDAIRPGITGDLVDASDYGAFVDVASDWLSRRTDQRVRDDCRLAAQVYGWARFDTEMAAWAHGAIGSSRAAQKCLE